MDFESEHINRLITLEPVIARLFDEFINQASFHLTKVQIDRYRRGIWSQNKTVERQLDELLREFAKKYHNLLQKYTADAWKRAQAKNDEILMKLVKGTGVVIAGSILLKIFDRDPGTLKPEQVTLENILRLDRRDQALLTFVQNRSKGIWSERVWNLAGENKRLIQHYLAEGLHEGRASARMATDLKRFLKNPDARFRHVRDPETGRLKWSKPAQAYHPGQGIYRSSYRNALRLARTETNMAYRMADMDRFQQVDFILGFEVMRSATPSICGLCDSMAGSYPKNFVFMGWHSSCRCYAVPILPSQDQFARYLNTGTVPGKSYIKGIPPDASDFVRSNAEKLQNLSSKPYWLRENFKIKNENFVPKF